MADSSKTIEENKEETKREIPSLRKICLVCGDRANGYNFNAISCESCKAFFRRNALSSKEFKCPFSNNCEVTAVTRRFCQKCRLEKCFEVGMAKEFIMSDKDKAEKRKKIAENRAKKRTATDSEEPVTSTKQNRVDSEISTSTYTDQQDAGVIQFDVLNSTTCSPNSTSHSSVNSELNSSVNSPQLYSQYMPVQHVDYSYSGYSDTRYMEVNPVNEAQMSYQPQSLDVCNISSMDATTFEKQNSIKSILTTEDTVIQCPKQAHVCQDLPAASSDPNANKAREILQDVERIEPNSIESILCEAIKLEFEAYTSLGCRSSSRELNEVERAKLNELIVANKALLAPIDEEDTQLVEGAAGGLKGTKQAPDLLSIVNLTAVAIRRLIKMAKKISAFRNMCEEDQVALLKGGCIEMMVLRSTMTYDTQTSIWKIPHSSEHLRHIRADVLKLAKGDVFRSYCAYVAGFEPAWRTDENVILVVSAILLFEPRRPRLVHTDVVKLEQNSYYYLLRRYLESVYPGCEARAAFLRLLQKILELHQLAAEVTGVYLDVDPLEPLLREIFDLKHRQV